MRTLDELRGSFASLRRAAKRSSGATDILSAVALSAARLEAYFATIFSRFLFRLTWLSFAISFALSVHERELEALEKRARLCVGLRRRIEDDVHPPHRLRLVVVDFDEHDVLLQAHGIVAAAVEALAVQTAEVADARQRHRDEAVEELVHLVLAQRDLHADRQVLADLEGRDRLLGTGDDNLLTGNRGQIVDGGLDLLGIRSRFAGADVQDDLIDLR